MLLRLITLLIVFAMTYNSCLAIDYSKKSPEEYNAIILNYEKALKRGEILKPEEVYLLGLTYYRIKDYKTALKYVKQAIKADPKLDKEKKLITRMKLIKEREEAKHRICSMKPKTYAPEALYKLVKSDRKVGERLKPAFYEILDFIWSDPEGKILLNSAISHKNKIRIRAYNQKNTNVEVETTKLKMGSFMGAYSSPSLTLHSDTVINIGEQFLQDFVSDDIDKKIGAIAVIVHEFCHAVPFDIPYNKNSKEEELAATMIGHNVAHRIFFNREMTREEAEYHSQEIYKAIIRSKDHNYLPIYNAFDDSMRSIGIDTPHYDVYRDIFYGNSSPRIEIIGD